MARKTYCDELVEYPALVMHLLSESTNVIRLLADDDTIEANTDEADEVLEKYFYNYLHVDPTATEVHAYVCVECEMPRVTSPTMKNLKLYVTIICNNDFMKLNPTKFKGMSGNRRDNLLRYIDLLLNESDIFGVGKLTLKSVVTQPAPKGFTARELTYEVPEFRGKIRA